MVSRRAFSLGITLLPVSAACGAPTLGARAENVSADPAHGAHTESTFAAKSDGVTLYEQSWRPDVKGGPARGALVIVHGLKDHGARYGELAARLTQHGISVHAMDLRGHGRSGGERVWVEKFQDYIDDVAQYIDLVRQREATPHLFVMGHSMGGAIAALYIVRKPPASKTPDGLILSGAALKAAVSGAKIFGTKIVAGIAPRAAVFQLDFEDFSHDPKVVAAGKADPLVYQPAAAAHTARELLAAMKPIEDNLATFELPLLLMHGEKDVVTDPEGTKALHQKAASKDKTLRIYAGDFHDILHEPDHEQVIADIDAFTTRLSR